MQLPYQESPSDLTGKSRGHRGKWRGSPQLAILLQDKSVGLAEALKRGLRIL